ncbi:MAG: hypothetical protein FWD11_09605, partial [Micrococcales bacterium]|nr:hypothetical protein [Micrococcales bacterium]
MTRPNRRRRLAAVIGGAAMVFVLSGCLKMEVSIDIMAEDDIRTTTVFGMDRSAAEAMATDGEEITPESLCEQSGTEDQFGSGNVTDVSDDKYIACKTTGTTTLADMSDSLKHQDGKYIFAMTPDNEDQDPSAAAMGAEMFDSFKVSVTFPGKVLEHNGSSTVSGTTVTWTDPADMYSSEGLRAVAEDTGSPGDHARDNNNTDRDTAGATSTSDSKKSGTSTVLWIVIGVVALLVIIGVVVAIVLLTRKKGGAPAPAYPQGPGFGQYPDGSQYAQAQQPGYPAGAYPQAPAPPQGPPDPYQAAPPQAPPDPYQAAPPQAPPDPYQAAPPDPYQAAPPQAPPDPYQAAPPQAPPDPYQA